MTSYLKKDAFPVGSTVKITGGFYAGRTGKVSDAPDWATATSLDTLWLDVDGEGLIWGWRENNLEPVDVKQTFKYEVSAGSRFSRTYDDEGKAIAVARFTRDYINSVGENGYIVTLTKTPTLIVPEKVEF